MDWSQIDIAQQVGYCVGPSGGRGQSTEDSRGSRDSVLNAGAMAAIGKQRPMSAAKRVRSWPNPRNAEPWDTDAQIRKTLWMPLMARSALTYRNPYQVRHTFASALLTSGANPWYVAQQLGHEDVEIVREVHPRGLPEAQGHPQGGVLIGVNRRVNPV